MTTARIIVWTQDHENYGEADHPHWKAKGGVEYCVGIVDHDEAARGQSYLVETYLDPVRSLIEYSNSMSRSRILDWDLLWDDQLTPDEKSQAEYDAILWYPAIGIGAGGDGPWWPLAAQKVMLEARARREEAYAEYLAKRDASLQAA